MRLLAAIALAVLLTAGAIFAAHQPAQLFPKLKDLMDDVPADFPRFFFSGHETDAQWLSRFLWYHFSRRSGHGKVLFNQEYLTTADMWMAGAHHPKFPEPIQQIHRDNLLAVRLDPEGYVWTHQHFSHAHEHGWPFPMWTQALQGPEGYTAGWHFQQDGKGWVWDNLRRKPDSPFARENAIKGWELENVRSLGIAEDKWQLEATGSSPAIVTPVGYAIDSLNAPVLQLRWIRTPKAPPGVLPYVEWMRAEDAGFGAERRVYFLSESGSDHETDTGSTHSLIDVYRHPLWKGRIKRIRIVLAPGEAGVKFAIDSFFTVYDTRHTINNPIYILACWNYFRWTGDLEFLRAVINNLRIALRYQQTVMGGLAHNFIRVPWVGHDGLPGYYVGPDGAKKMNWGHRIGIDCEFWESSLVPSIVVYGFLGLEPKATELAVNPRLPSACPEMGISDLLYRNVRLDLKARRDALEIVVKDQPRDPLRIALAGKWKRTDTGESAAVFALTSRGVYRFVR